MASAGYSGTPLPQKLGIKAGARVLLVDAPKGFDKTLGALPAGATLAKRGGTGAFAVIVAFFEVETELARSFAGLAQRLEPSGGLWIGWPKKASKRATDIDEHAVRAIGLDAGLVDNKVCAIDETWSGLRFVVRVADRLKKKTAR